MLKKIYPLFLSCFLYADNSIIVYNDNLSLFDITTKINPIKSGSNNIILENISPNLLSDSVSPIFPKGVSVLEQNFKYDLISQNNVLKQYINKSISFNESGIIKTGTLLSIENDKVFLNEDKGYLKLVPIKDILISAIPAGMITKPSLVFKINSEDNIDSPEISLKYLSTGFSWKSDYIATIIDNNLYINGLITLKNESEVSLDNYNLKLVAGKVNNVDNQVVSFNRPMLAKAQVMAMDSSIQTKSFSGYHVYSIPFKVDVDKRSSKQINYFNNKIKEFEIYNELNLSIYDHMELSDLKFNQVIKFDNTKLNGLGEALPEGIFRVYRKDNVDNTTYFIGSVNIEDKPKDESVLLNIGDNFDSLISIKSIDSKNISNKSFITYNYNIRNNGNKTEKYLIKQNLPFFNNDKLDIIKSKNCLNDKKCIIKKSSDSFVEIEIYLNSQEKYSFDITYSN